MTDEYVSVLPVDLEARHSGEPRESSRVCRGIATDMLGIVPLSFEVREEAANFVVEERMGCVDDFDALFLEPLIKIPVFSGD